MRNELVFAGLALVLAAGAANATGVTPGHLQLANQLGVEAGASSAGELAQIADARRDNDQSTVAWLLAHGNSRASAETSVGKAQIAAQLGVDASDFTAAELTQIADAKRDGNLHGVRFILKHENRNDYYFPQPAVGHDK
ncbi:hypothetical protein C8J30_10930 [Rhodobacter viridis]|uniref:DUF4148 domain-containing protein n=1 Tax=Rhodobacter viridis TaxID=1054202 RepID=A0A318TXA5_9RHOB|nr:hypothetical protein [Rhodobacter viridis]PYF09284.1 hypothetical protein C8J30_10930 [Rhodobacter viridis]